jgi:hypothetical protein
MMGLTLSPPFHRWVPPAAILKLVLKTPAVRREPLTEAMEISGRSVKSVENGQNLASGVRFLKSGMPMPPPLLTAIAAKSKFPTRFGLSL